MPPSSSLNRLIAVLISATALTACSIHPIPDNVSRYSTEQIVRNVRCEAKKAVRHHVKEHLLEAADELDHRPDLQQQLQELHGNEEKVLMPRVKALLDEVDAIIQRKYSERNQRTEKIRDRKLWPSRSSLFDSYAASAISYQFKFEIDEINDQSGSLSFKIPYNGTDIFSLSLGGSADKKRTGLREFTMTETLYDLQFFDCKEDAKIDRNYLYPITGSVGMYEIMSTFIRVSELGGGDKNFKDTLTFTTEVKGSVEPKLVLAPVVDKFKLVGADAKFDASRKDTHTLTVTIAFPLNRLALQRATSAAEFERIAENAKERSRLNLCIARGEAREDAVGSLRDIPPQQYCRDIARDRGGF